MMFARFPHHSEAAKTRCGSSFPLPVRTGGFTVLLSISFCVNLKTLLIGGGGHPGGSSRLDIGWFHFHPRDGNPHDLTESFVTLTQHVSSVARRVRLFANPWTAARQASLSITNSESLLKLMSTELVMPSNHLILCRHVKSLIN